MHRLLLIAGALCLLLGTAVSQAQPPWPETTRERDLQSAGLISTARDSLSAPRRITPRSGSNEISSRPREEPRDRRPASPWTAFASLAMILIAIVAAARLWKKHGPAVGVGLSAEAVEVLGKRPFDRRHSIQIIRCGSRILVLGVADEGLRTLAEISDPAEVDHLTRLCRRSLSDESGPNALFAMFRRSHDGASMSDGPDPRGRVDQVLAERFSHAAAGIGEQSEGFARA